MCFFFQNLPSAAVVGIDPWCVSVETAQRYEHAFAKNKQKLFQLSTNLVDEVWKDRPPVEIRPVSIHPLEVAGHSVAEKLEDLREKLLQEKTNGIVITTLDEVSIFPFMLFLYILFVYFSCTFYLFI